VFQIDTALNIIWALFCVVALVYYVRSERGHNRRARLFRGVALFLAVVSLFPCVSASDDSVRLQFFATNHRTPGKPQTNSSPGTSLGSLVRLLESLESVQVPIIWALSVNLFCYTLVLVEWSKGHDRPAPPRSGRAPPSPLVPA
jgi:hypothetical protein